MKTASPCPLYLLKLTIAEMRKRKIHNRSNAKYYAKNREEINKKRRKTDRRRTTYGDTIDATEIYGLASTMQAVK